MPYPYLPPDQDIGYVPTDNRFIEIAKSVAENNSLDPAHPTGAVVVKNDKVIGSGANGSTWHQTHDCERKKRGIPTGEGYELCEGCHPKNHAEQKALVACQESAEGGDLYLWGHWWCCQSCWDKMIKAGIKNVYLPEGATEIFRK